MNTSTEALRLLQEARGKAEAAAQVISDLIVAHDYQDVAALVTQAAVALLDAAEELMKSQDERERADDLLDAVYDIIDGETDEE
jgi:hypothetical protein